jgi:FAD dependent oxidoreductase TIGR03364
LQETLGVEFHWGKTVTEVHPGYISIAGQTERADQIFICSGSDFETLYPEEFAKFALTKCKLQMMRMVEEGTPRIGPAICGGLSLIHYASFKASPSLTELRKRYEREMAEMLQWGIHVMISQNRLGELTIGDSHEYGQTPDPFDRKHINDLILQYLEQFATLKNPKLIETWNGVYGKFTSGQTELFHSPDREVFILNGVGGTGMTMSFGFAEERINSL